MASHWTPSSVGRPASRGGSQISSALRPLSAIRPPPTSSRAATGVCKIILGKVILQHHRFLQHLPHDLRKQWVNALIKQMRLERDAASQEIIITSIIFLKPHTYIWGLQMKNSFLTKSGAFICPIQWPC